jgi:cytochrome P450
MDWVARLLERAAPSPPPPAPPPSLTLLQQLLAAPPRQLEAAAALALALALAVALLLPRVASSFSAWRRWSRIPGPPARFFLLGHAPELNTPRAPMVLLDYAEKYGDVFRVRLAHRRAVVVADPSVFAALTKRGGAHARLPKDEAIYAPLNVGIEGRPRSLLTEPLDSPLWSCVRKAISPAFSVSALRAHVFPPLKEMLERVTGHLRHEHARLVVAERNPAEAAEIDVEDLAKRLTSDLIAILLFSAPLGGTQAFVDRPLPPAGSCGTPEAAAAAHALALKTAERLLADPTCDVSADEYTALVEALLETARRALGNPLRRPFAPLLRFWGDAGARLDAKLEGAFSAMMKAKVERLGSAEGAPPEGSLARAILGAVDPSTGLGLPLNRRASELSVVVNAGFETTSRAIVCTLAALAEHPDAQERLAQELAGAGLAPCSSGDTTKKSNNKPQQTVRPLEWSDLSPSALPYLHAVTREALRLYPPAALGTGRVVTSAGAAAGGDLKGVSGTTTDGELICGVDVPPGTVVMLPVFVASRRTSAYGPDAGAFRPERWLPPASASDGGDPSSSKASPIPEPPTFSFGPRDCVGMPLAKVELLAVVAALVAAFRWRPAQRVVDGGGLEGLLHFRITLGTESGMPLLFEPR